MTECNRYRGGGLAPNPGRQRLIPIHSRWAVTTVIQYNTVLSIHSATRGYLFFSPFIWSPRCSVLRPEEPRVTLLLPHRSSSSDSLIHRDAILPTVSGMCFPLQPFFYPSINRNVVILVSVDLIILFIPPAMEFAFRLFIFLAA